MRAIGGADNRKRVKQDGDVTQGLSQDLETGCLKLAIEKLLGVQIFEGYYNTLRFPTINICEFIKIRHDILIQCHRNNMEVNKFDYMLEIDILRNSSPKILGVLRGAF